MRMLVRENEREYVGLLVEQAAEQRDERPRGLRKSRSPRTDLGDAPREIAVMRGEDLSRDIVLRAEVAIERRVRHADRLRDVAHGRAIEPFFGEQPQRLALDLRPRVGAAISLLIHYHATVSRPARSRARRASSM